MNFCLVAICSAYERSYYHRDNQALTDEVEKELKEREWLEGELRAQYEAAEGTDQEMLNLQTFVRKLHTLVEDKTKALDTQKVRSR